MSIKKRRVKYDCVNWREYNISFRAYLHILRINLLLWLKRQYRRLLRAVGYCKYSLLIVPFWFLFVVIVYYWGRNRGINQAFADVLWDLKSGFFSSVVISAAVSFFTQYTKDKNKYSVQHHYYIKAMHCFSDFYDSLLEISGLGRTGCKPPFDPFYYSDDIRSSLRNVFPQTLDVDNKTTEIKKVLQKEEKVKNAISRLSDRISAGDIADCEYTDFLECEDYCLPCLNRLEDELTHSTRIQHWDIIVMNCVSELYTILEFIRKPWRRDLKYKIDILKTIYEQDKTIACTNYLESFLGVVDYDSYDRTTEEIVGDFLRTHLVTDPSQEAAPGFVRVTIPSDYNKRYGIGKDE